MVVLGLALVSCCNSVLITLSSADVLRTTRNALSQSSPSGLKRQRLVYLTVTHFNEISSSCLANCILCTLLDQSSPTQTHTHKHIRARVNAGRQAVHSG